MAEIQGNTNFRFVQSQEFLINRLNGAISDNS